MRIADDFAEEVNVIKLIKKTAAGRAQLPVQSVWKAALNSLFSEAPMRVT